MSDTDTDKDEEPSPEEIIAEIERLVAEAAENREPHVNEMDPYALHHLETIRKAHAERVEKTEISRASSTGDVDPHSN